MLASEVGLIDPQSTCGRQCIYKTDERLDIPQALEYVQGALTAADGLPLYVATDNAMLKARLREVRGAHVHGCNDCARHIASDQFTRTAAPAKLMFAELGLLASASILFCPPGYASRFFRTAIYIRGAACTTIVR